MNFEKKKMSLVAKISASIMVLGVGLMGVLPSVVPNIGMVNAEKIKINNRNSNIFYCSQTKTLTVPTIRNNDVLDIDDNIKSEVENIVISEQTTIIPAYAFENCAQLTNITIPSNVTSIGCYAFYGCSKLNNIIIPDNVTSIRKYAFDGCRGLTSITIPTSVTSIGDGAFYNCSKLNNIIIPDSVTSIGSFAFYNCSKLNNIIIPNSVTSIWNCAFFGCSNLTDIKLPNSVPIRMIKNALADFDRCSNFNNNKTHRYNAQPPDGEILQQSLLG